MLGDRGCVFLKARVHALARVLREHPVGVDACAQARHLRAAHELLHRAAAGVDVCDQEAR